MRRNLEEVLAKNGELSRANSDLRHRLSDVESQLKEQREKTTTHKRQVEHLNKVREKQTKTIRSLEVCTAKWTLL